MPDRLTGAATVRRGERSGDATASPGPRAAAHPARKGSAMSARHWSTPSRTLARSVAAGLLAAALAPALGAAGPAGASPASVPQFSDQGATVTLRVPGSAGAPGY